MEDNSSILGWGGSHRREASGHDLSIRLLGSLRPNASGIATTNQARVYASHGREETERSTNRWMSKRDHMRTCRIAHDLYIDVPIAALVLSTTTAATVVAYITMYDSATNRMDKSNSQIMQDLG